MSDTLEVLMADTPEEVKTQGIFKNESGRAAFNAYLQKEMQSVAEGEDTADLNETLKKWRRQRMARPENKIKNYPFPNSANVSPPITAQKVNTIYAKALANFSTKRPFWSGETSDAMYRPHVEALAKYMNLISASPFDLNLDSINRVMLYEIISLGTEFYEVSWDYEQVTYMKDVAGSQEPAYRVLHNGPRVTPIAIEDLLTRPYWTNPQKAPWIARRFRLTRGELLERKASGRYDPDACDKITGGISELTDHEQQENEIQGINTKPVADYPETELYDLYAFHAFWDVNEDGVLEDIKGVIELSTGTILRVEMNNLGVRLIGRIPYQEIPGQLLGVGVCHACEYLQDEAETLHNQRLDNLKWSMLNMFKAKKGGGIKVDEQAYPGKIWFVNENDDFMPMFFPDLSASSYQAEMLVRDYADRITGANDPMSGFADQTLKSGGGAQAQMTMMQQASSILNAQLDTMEEYYSEMGRMIAILLAANVDLVDFSIISEEDALLVKEILSIPIEELPSKIKFRVETTDAARSEASKKENYAAFMMMYNQYAETIMKYAMAGANPQMPPALQIMTGKFIVGQTEIMRKMIDFLKIGDPEKYLPYFGDLEAQINIMEDQKEATVAGQGTGNQQGVGSTGGVGVQPGMGGGSMGGMGGQAGNTGGIPAGNGGLNAGQTAGFNPQGQS